MHWTFYIASIELESIISSCLSGKASSTQLLLWLVNIRFIWGYHVCIQIYYLCISSIFKQDNWLLG